MPGLTWSRKISIVSAFWLLNFFGLPASAQIRFDLPAQPLAQSLTAVGSLASLNIYYDPPLVRDLKAPALKAVMSADDALTHLLVGTGLRAVRVDANTVRVIGEGTSKRTQSTHDANTGALYAPANAHLAAANTDAESVNDKTAVKAGIQNSDSSTGSRGALEEIVVTAQKREERLQDVPLPVTALSADTLVENNQLRLRDYYSSVPGLVVAPALQSSQQVSIRGIAPGNGNPTVGLTVDDLPYGASTTVEGGLTVPDIDPGDLDHIEVLRGPQGTLYGASSLGGLIKFVTVDPSTDKVSGRVEAGTSSVYNGAELGYSLRGSANVPLSDTFAVRVSGFTRQDPGYIDNPVLHIDGINKADVDGGRLAALWRPSELFSLKLSALYQDFKGHGLDDVDLLPGLGDLQQSYAQRVGPYSRTVQAYSATAHAKLGSVDLTAVSGYSINAFHDTYDLTSAFGPLTQAAFGVSGSPDFEDVATKKLTQEIRLSASIGPRVDWLLGAFYTHERATFNQTVYAEDPVTGPLLGVGQNYRNVDSYEEYAVFGDVTFHVTDRFDVQVGGREAYNKQASLSTPSGILFGSSIVSAASKDNSFTYLVTPRFKVSSDLMVYARLASGYRAGGPNNAAPGVPLTYKPDSTQNYEIGVKGDFLDHTISVDTSLYYIDWKNTQISEAVDNLYGYVGNGGRAKSQGVEFSVESRPLTGLTIAAWVAYDEAVLTQALPPTSTSLGAAGDRLPLSSRFSGNLSLLQNFPLWSTVTGFVGGSVSYVGDRKGGFVGESVQRQDLPAYTKTDLRAGAKYESWTANLFVTNLADKRGLLNGGPGTFPAFAYVYIQPRTVGVSVSRTF
jgi:iron complex outermembrane receptor protein